MSFLSRSRILVSSVCRSSGLLEQRGLFRGVNSLTKPQRHVTVNLSSCQQHCRHVSSLRCCFGTKRCFSGVGENTHSDEESPREMDNNNSPPIHRPSETFNLDVLVSLLRQENAVDICVIKVPDHIKYAEYFIVVSGVSSRHIRAMALYAIKVYKFLKKDRDPNVKIEGKDAEDWMCIDFGKMVVHFMLPEAREVYELEKLWTLRACDEQLKSMPAEMLPEDFIFDAELTK